MRIIKTNINDKDYKIVNLLNHLSSQLSDGYWEDTNWHNEFWNYLSISTPNSNDENKRFLKVIINKYPIWKGVKDIFSTMSNEEVIHYIGEVLEEVFEDFGNVNGVFNKIWVGTINGKAKYISYVDIVPDIINKLKNYKYDNTCWREEIKNIVNKGCSDSDIEDYIKKHSNINGKDIWNYLYELNAPKECKGCVHIQMSGMFPCNVCTRKIQLKDYYETK